MNKIERARYTARYHYDATEHASIRYKASETLNESDAFEILDTEIESCMIQLAAKDKRIAELETAEIDRINGEAWAERARNAEAELKNWKDCEYESQVKAQSKRIAELEAVIAEAKKMFYGLERNKFNFGGSPIPGVWFASDQVNSVLKTLCAKTPEQSAE